MIITMTSMDDVDSIPAGWGVVVTRIALSQTPAPGPSPRLTFHRVGQPFMLASGLFFLTPGTTSYVLLLKPYRYHWNELFFGAGSLGASNFPQEHAFECVADKAVYAGDVDISVDLALKKYGARFVDRIRLAQEAYAGSHPRLSSRLPLLAKVAG